MLSLPTFSLTGCFLILCHYFKLMEPVTTLQSASTISSTAQLSSKISGSGSSKTFKGRRSPVPKPLSEDELKSQKWTWIDWAWWTAFNFSISKFILEYQSKLFGIYKYRGIIVV